MSSDNNIENNVTVQLGRAYDEESENLKVQWRSLL